MALKNLTITIIALIILSLIFLIQSEKTTFNNRSFPQKNQSKTNLTQDNIFYLTKQLNLKQQQGAISSFSTLQSITFDQITMVLITQRNKAYIYICDAYGDNCKKQNTVTVDVDMSIYASALSQDQQILVFGGSNGFLYIYKKVTPYSKNFSYILSQYFQPFNESIKAIKLGSKAIDLIVGGTQKIAKYYRYNQTSTNKYEYINDIGSVPTQIITITQLYQTASDRTYLFITCQTLTKIYLYNVSTKIFDFKFNLFIENVVAIAPAVYLQSNNNGVFAFGSTYGVVTFYQFVNFSTNVTQVQIISYSELGAIKSLSFSKNGQFLVIGNHNLYTYVYKRKILQNNTYKWELYQTIQFSKDVSNFAAVVKINRYPRFIITGSDDLYVRFYTYGTCPSGTDFDGFGRCNQKSYTWLIVGLSIGGVLIIAAVIFICKKRVIIPSQSKIPASEIDYLPSLPKKSENKQNSQKSRSKYSRLDQ